MRPANSVMLSDCHISDTSAGWVPLASPLETVDHGGGMSKIQMSGYSQKPLAQKLGIKPGMRIVAIGAPDYYPALLGDLPPGASLHSRLSRTSRFIHRFVSRRVELQADFRRLTRSLADDGTLWISWPKRSSGIATDLNENLLRDMGLPLGMVDVKVCAVDEVWSGLKFVRRVENRSP